MFFCYAPLPPVHIFLFSLFSLNLLSHFLVKVLRHLYILFLFLIFSYCKGIHLLIPLFLHLILLLILVFFFLKLFIPICILLSPVIFFFPCYSSPSSSSFLVFLQPEHSHTLSSHHTSPFILLLIVLLLIFLLSLSIFFSFSVYFSFFSEMPYFSPSSPEFFTFFSL